jgi:hypothetical protein
VGGARPRHEITTRHGGTRVERQDVYLNVKLAGPMTRQPLHGPRLPTAARGLPSAVRRAAKSIQHRALGTLQAVDVAIGGKSGPLPGRNQGPLTEILV